MRVLYLTEETIQFSEPMVRGGAIHVRNVVEGLRDRGHDVFLLDWNETPEREYRVSIRPRSRYIDGALRTLRRAFSLGDRHNFDVIVSKTRKTYLPGLVAARRLGVPHVVHVGSSPGAGTRDTIVDRLDSASVSLRLRAPHDAYFVVCESIAAELRAWNVRPTRIYNVQNAVDTDRFRPAEGTDSTTLDRLEADDRDSIRIGYVGGLYSYKGLYDLAAAVEKVTANVEVIIAGDGPERDGLETTFGDTATFLGAVPYDRIPAVYHAVDAFVLPSHTEGLPRVILEAQATETPVVATRVGGIPEVVTDGETGLLCDPIPEELAGRIDVVAEDEQLRTRLGENGRRAVVERFSWEEMYDRYERFLEAIIGSTRLR